MKIFLYRRSLDLRSGAGQLIRLQALGLRAAGHEVRVVCQRGAAKFFFRTGLAVARRSRRALAAWRAAAGERIVDHELRLPQADIVFVHGLYTEAQRHLRRDDWLQAVADEARFFEALAESAPIVANSAMIEAALIERFGLAAERISVCYPGIDAARFNPARAAALRAPARRALGVAARTPLLGFVTSGDFQTRGLDVFLDAAERIAAARADAEFLVVGSKRLPAWAAGRRLVRGGRVHYRPKSGRPERWLAALDLFLYPARFDAFGMVVAEALAAGVPVLTSRRVGASECLPAEYAAWTLESPAGEPLAGRAIALLDDAAARARLTAAGVESMRGRDQARYARAAADRILAQKR